MHPEVVLECLRLHIAARESQAERTLLERTDVYRERCAERSIEREHVSVVVEVAWRDGVLVGSHCRVETLVILPREMRPAVLLERCVSAGVRRLALVHSVLFGVEIADR